VHLEWHRGCFEKGQIDEVVGRNDSDTVGDPTKPGGSKMAARTLRTAALALVMSLVLVPAAFAFPEEPIEDAYETVVEFIESLFGGGDEDPENVNHEVVEWDGDGGGGSGGDGSAPRLTAEG